jgi:hypothetical protein
MAALVWAPIGECRTYEKIAPVAVTGITEAKLVHDGKIAKGALISVETAALRITMDGTTPVATATGGGQGHYVDTGQSIILQGTETLRNFKAIEAVHDNGGVAFISLFF